MAQVKIYGLREHLDPRKSRMSEIVHACAMDVLQLPEEKRFHRFFPITAEDFIYPADRTAQYTIIEISMFEGRSIATKKRLIRLLFDRLAAELHISPQDLEITISETPAHSWGIRGVPGSELSLSYRVDV